MAVKTFEDVKASVTQNRSCDPRRDGEKQRLVFPGLSCDLLIRPVTSMPAAVWGKQTQHCGWVMLCVWVRERESKTRTEECVGVYGWWFNDIYETHQCKTIKVTSVPSRKAAILHCISTLLRSPHSLIQLKPLNAASCDHRHAATGFLDTAQVFAHRAGYLSACVRESVRYPIKPLIRHELWGCFFLFCFFLNWHCDLFDINLKRRQTWLGSQKCSFSFQPQEVNEVPWAWPTEPLQEVQHPGTVSERYFSHYVLY